MDRHELDVSSTVILLRPEADGPAMTGRVERDVLGQRYIDFKYRIVRAWELPIARVLSGGPGMLPLAPLCDVSAEQLPDVIRRMEARLSQEVSPAEAATLWTATYLLMGLRYPDGFAEQLLQGVRAMEESTTYQAIMAKGAARGRAEGIAAGRVEGIAAGRVESARNILLRQGRKKFGEPSPSNVAAIEAIAAADLLEALADKMIDANSWTDLLAR